MNFKEYLNEDLIKKLKNYKKVKSFVSNNFTDYELKDDPKLVKDAILKLQNGDTEQSVIDWLESKIS